LAGGFHHAFAGHGEGFCMINDLAVAIRHLQKDGSIRTALVVDCDVHQGNGTAAIFRGDPSVFTFSIHQENNYPVKEQSHLDIGLPDNVADAQYLEELERGLALALEGIHPDLILYQAGADPFVQDQLGGLAVTIAGLKARDRLVYETARDQQIPIAVTLGGGYAVDVNDTIRIHCNTVVAAKEVFEMANLE
jgi:acetoin utilization deacetylase AcuC-like enzyme